MVVGAGHAGLAASRFLTEHAKFRRYLMRELERNGPMLSRDLKADLLPSTEPHRWWGNRQVRLMLEILQQRGEVAVAGRVGKQRLWDVADNPVFRGLFGKRAQP